MNNPFFRRGMSLVLCLAMTLCGGLAVRAAEEDGLCDHHPAHTSDCGYAATGECTHECTADTGCITIRCSHQHVATCFDTQGNSFCRHACTDTPACYTPVVACVHSQHGSCGHNEGQDCSFAVNGCEECAKTLIALKGTDVVLTDGTEYVFTGQEIRPHVTVMVDRVVLVEDRQYTLTYTDNIAVGTGAVTVTGLEDAGYTGQITIPFSILPAAATEPEAPSEPEAPTEPEVPSEPVTPTEPEAPTQPEETRPQETEPEETKPADYKIIKGNGSKWRKDSGIHLSLTLNADTEDITAIRINGKLLGTRHYALKDKGLVLLKNSWLEEQALGTDRITVEFADGDAEGTFTIARAADDSNPKTGDSIMLWVGLMILSLLGGAALLFLNRKKFFK